MADLISHGKTANIQRPMLDNKDILNKIPGVHITDVGGRLGPVDDHMGPKTATALESILIAAGFNKGAELSEKDQGDLADFLAERGMDVEQAKQFAEAAAVITNDPELGAVFRECSKADEAKIREAIVAEKKVQEPAPADQKPEPTSPKEPGTNDLPKGVGTPTEEKPWEVMRAEAPASSGEEPPADEHKEIAVALKGEEVNIGNGLSITMDKEDAVAFAANTEVKTSEPAPVFEEYNIGGGFSVMACHVSGTELPPSPEEITKLFGDAVAHENPDVIGTYTVADVQGMKANDPSPFQQKIIEVVLGKHEERSESDKARQEQIAALREEQSAIGPAMNACIEDTIRAAMKIDDLDKAMVNAKFDFAATIDGKEVRFEDNTKTGGTDSRLSMQQIIDGDIPGISSPYLEPFDYKRVKEAGAEAFHNKMMTSEGYAALFNDYKGSLVRLEGADHVGELPNIAFKEHFDQLDLFDNLRHGEFMGGLRELNTSIAALEESTEQIKGDADSATYVVKQSDLDALANPTEVIAKQDATTPALPQV